MKRMRAIRAAAAVALALALTGAGPAAAPPRVLRSPNWSGYVALACRTCAFRSVTATWRVPAVNCAASPFPVAWAEAWAGLGGWGTGSVAQAGTASVCTGGVPSYFAWYQMYPARPVVAYNAARTAYGVGAGDLITASVTYHAGRWRLVLEDHATGTHIATAQPCPPAVRCGNVSAEVIMEAPSAGATVPLADFGTVTFTSVAVTGRDGTRGDLAGNRLWSVAPAVLTGAGGDVLAVPGPVHAGTAFTVIWHAAR